MSKVYIGIQILDGDPPRADYFEIVYHNPGEEGRTREARFNLTPLEVADLQADIIAKGGNIQTDGLFTYITRWEEEA